MKDLNESKQNVQFNKKTKLSGDEKVPLVAQRKHPKKGVADT
jgi:hypothetical protein